jgi:surface protein
MLLLAVIALPGIDAGVIDLATLTTSPYTGSTVGNPNDISVCGNGPEQGFSHVLAPGHGIAIGQTSTSFDSKHTLRHGGQYPGQMLVACVNAPDDSPMAFVNDGVEDVTVYFIVDASSSGEAGAFTVEWLLYTVGKDPTKVMANLGPEPRPRQGRVLGTYTALTDSNIKTAAQLWVSDQASASSTYGLVHTWDLSQVTNLEKVWCGYGKHEGEFRCGSAYMAMRSFNGDISEWDVSNVITLEVSFDFASAFNSDISKWDTSKVTNMHDLFARTSVFNSDISKWDVSKVTNMWATFYCAAAFNGDTSKWDVAKVIDMSDSKSIRTV